MFKSLFKFARQIPKFSTLPKAESPIFKYYIDVLGVGVMGCVVGYSFSETIPFTKRSHVILYPDFLQKAIKGTEIHLLRLQRPLLKSPDPLVLRVEGIVKRLESCNDLGHFNFQVIAVNDGIRNFSSIIAGGLVVHARFIEMDADFSDDGLLAAALAHEMGHVIAKHAVEGFSRASACNSTALYFIFRGMRLQRYFGIGMAVVVKVVDFATRFIPAQRREYEADEIGIMLLANAGYDPRYSVKLLQKLHYSPSSSRMFMQTHPSSQRRVERLIALADGIES